MIDRTLLTEALAWWVDLLADLEPDTKTFTVTMSRVMAERTLAATERLLDFPTDEQVEAAAIAVADEWGHTWDQLDAESQDAATHLVLAVLEAVTMIGDTE